MKQSMLFYPPVVNYDFKLTIGQNYDVEMGFYQSGFFKNDFGGISPAQFMQHTIEKVGNVSDPEYWYVEVFRYNSSSDFKGWVSSDRGDAPVGTYTTDIQIIMSYSASINGVTPNVLDY